MEVQSGKPAQDYDSLRIFECPTYYHVKEDKLDYRAKKYVFWVFKKGIKGYKIWDPKDKKTILSRGVTFDESSMVKPTEYQQVESEKTIEVSQRVESDTTLCTLSSSISYEIPPTVTQDDNYVANEDTEYIEKQKQVMGQV